LQSILFTHISLPNKAPVQSIKSGTQIAQLFPVAANSESGGALSNIANEFNGIAEQYGNSFHMSQS
jgi:hypothetical protein